MIVNDLTNSNAMNLDGLVYTANFTMASSAAATPDKLIESLSTCGCDCGCDSCSYVNKVYAEASFTNALKNDKTQVFGIALSTTSYVTFFIEKEIGETWTEQVEIVNNTYGTWTDIGSYASQPKLATLYLEWAEVLSAFGEGTYRVRWETDPLGGGAAVATYSQEYYLQIYKADRANGTVVFNWYQDGKIFNNEINFTGLNIEQWMRLPGKIGYDTPELIIDEIEDSSHNFVQIQDKLEEVYSFESHLLSFYATQKLLKDVFFGNEIYITDFNLYSHAPVNNMLLKPINIGEVKEYPFNACAKIKVGLKPKVRNNIKRNFF